jgi:hypothetical protein
LAWGDGGGFGGTDSDGRVSQGVARLEGTPPNWRGANLWGGKNRVSSQATVPGKARILAVGNVIYLWSEKQDDWTTSRIIKSTDYGKTWSVGNFAFEMPLHRFCPIQFGRGYEGAPDSYVYGYFANPDGKSLGLARVPKTEIENRNAYQVFAGFDSDDKPTWSTKLADREPIFTDPVGVNWGYQAVYHPVLQRYLLTVTHGGVEEGPGLGIFDAPEPWGPWTTVYYSDAWKDSKNKFCFSFPQKWMSADGKTGWMVHSGWPEYDNYNHIKYILTFKTPSDSGSPETPTGLKVEKVP